jgi:mRNA interferase MazF
MADIGAGRKPWLVVSNNARNRQLDSCLAVRITTTPKPRVASIVELSPHDPVAGRVLCDDIAILYRDELLEDRGALAPDTMRAIADGLRVALAL